MDIGITLRRLAPGFAVLLLLVLAAGCSTTRLAYNNADWLVQRGAGSYVDLEREQARHLRSKLREHLAWHCETQLPGYVGWLDALEDNLLARPPQRDALAQRLTEAEAAFAALGLEVTPTMQWLLADLSPEQQRGMAAKLAERDAELRAEYLDIPLAQQIEARAERLELRLQRWLGRLHAEQRSLIAEWSAARGEHNREWLENRRQWQDALLAALELPAAESAVVIAELVQHPEALHTPDWQRRQSEAREAALDLTVGLLQLASDLQRQQLQRELTKLRRDFQALSCAG